MNPTVSNPPLSRRLPAARGGLAGRLVRLAALGLGLLYVLAVGGGYFWLHSIRHVEQVRLVDVALFRRGAVLRALAAQQFGKAQEAQDRKQYQAAYVWYTAALRNDPTNTPGRLGAARFVRSLGEGPMALALLQEGLALNPDDASLITATFEQILGLGRNRQALDLLHKTFADRLDGPNGALLRTFEVQATLGADGAPAARTLLAKYPDLPQYRRAVPLVAQVLWDSHENARAVDLLSSYLQQPPETYLPYAQLAGWQETGGQAQAALDTLRRACTQFPREISPRILLIGKLPFGTLEFQREVEGYLKDFARQPETVMRLASLCGSKGWVDLAHALYLAGANRQEDLGLLALSYGEALAMHGRLQDYADILAQVETQVPETNTSFLVVLRQQQAFTAAALGDRDGARDFARRLAVVLHNDPDQLEIVRRRFANMGLTEAVAELSASGPNAKPPRALEPGITAGPSGNRPPKT